MRLRIASESENDSDALLLQMRVRQHQQVGFWVTWSQTGPPWATYLESAAETSFGNSWTETGPPWNTLPESAAEASLGPPWTTQPENWLACRLLSSQSQQKSPGLLRTCTWHRSAIIATGARSGSLHDVCISLVDVESQSENWKYGRIGKHPVQFLYTGCYRTLL